MLDYARSTDIPNLRNGAELNHSGKFEYLQWNLLIMNSLICNIALLTTNFPYNKKSREHARYILHGVSRTFVPGIFVLLETKINGH